MPFPPRTRASDAILRNLYRHLVATNVANGGQNRCMVTVVVTGDIDIPNGAFIATSGGAGVFGGLRTAIQNLRGNGIYGGVSYTLVNFSRNTNLIQMRNSPDPSMPGVPFLRSTPRNCAEPKALEAAAETGQALTGMSTFWWGNTPNAYPAPNADTTLPAVPWALPCPFCQANEENIMRTVSAQRLNRRAGVAIRSAEI